MKIEWSTGKEDRARIRALVRSQGNNAFVKRRIRNNVDTKYIPEFGRQRFWKVMVECLLTTQQRAGPDSAVTRFSSVTPFPLDLQECSRTDKVSSFVEDTLASFGGMRRTTTIGRQIENNLVWLNNNGWSQIEGIADELAKCRKREPRTEDIAIERKAANFVAKNLAGFGPKQSRNLWQTLGLLRFEIPIDSRITKWLNRKNFLVKLSAIALADNNYYEFVMTGIQRLCEKCQILTCVFDAAVFSSFDREWTEDTLVY